MKENESMENNIDFGKEIPELNLSYSTESSSNIMAEFDANAEEAMRILDEANKRKRDIQKALDQNADNTAEGNIYLKKLIDLQEEQIDFLKQQLEKNSEQLKILRDIFSTDADSVSAEQEIIELIRKLTDKNHPVRDFFVDKGGDLAIEAGSVILEAIKILLISKGIIL